MTLALGGCESDHERADRLVSEARAYVERGEHDEATLALLESAIAIEGERRDAWQLLARAQLGAEGWSDAATSAERAIALSSGAPSADDLEVLGRARAGEESWEPARDAMLRALEADGTRQELRTELGRVYEHLDETDAALETYTEVVEADARAVEARLRLAALLIRFARGELGAPEPEPAWPSGLTPDVHADQRQRARTLLAEARASLAGDDPRGAAVRAYEEELDELDAAVAARIARAEAAERERADAARALEEALRADITAQSLLLGALGDSSGALADVLRQGAITGEYDVPPDALRGVGVGSASGGGLRSGGGLGSLGGGLGGGLGGVASGTPREAPPTHRVEVSATTSGALDAARVSRVVRGHVTAMRRCYETAARTMPSLAGSIDVAIEVDAGGQARGATTSGSITNASMRSCVEAVVSRIAFPTAEGSSRVRIHATFAHGS